MKIVILSICVALILFSCQSARELHYFKSGDNYYRLRIKESSFASKSRYLAGYFDEKAVDKYFGEMSQPDSGKFTEWVSGTTGSQLVMILSTNSNSIAEQIGNLASNEALLENIAILANRDKIQAGKIQAGELQELRKIGEEIVMAGNAYFPDADSSNIQLRVKDFLENLKLKVKGKFIVENMEAAISKFN